MKTKFLNLRISKIKKPNLEPLKEFELFDLVDKSELRTFQKRPDLIEQSLFKH